MQFQDLSLSALSELVSRAMRADPESVRRLRTIDGRVICVQLTDWREPVRFFFFPSEAGLRIARGHDGEAEVTISGSVAFFLRLLFASASAAPQKNGGLQISGDIELGRRFERLLTGAHIDWEELTSRWMGDVAARRLGNLLRAARDWGREARATLGADIGEYLQEEARLLAKRARVEAFLRAVDRLRADVDRLDKRIERLDGVH